MTSEFKAMVWWLTVFLFALSLVTPAVGQAATTYYVSTRGNDENPGTIDKPFRTIKKGIEAASSGDTVYIRGGVYHETVTLPASKSGTESARTVISGYPEEIVVVDGEDLLPKGDYPNARHIPLFNVDGARYVTVKDIAFTWSRGIGIQVKNGSYVTLQNIDSSFNWFNGIRLKDSLHTLVENCRLWENARNAAPDADGRDPLSPPGRGILVIEDSDYTIIRGCTIYENYGEGLIDQVSRNSTIEDNVLYDNKHAGIYLDNSQYSLTQRNLIFSTDNKRFWKNADRPSTAIVIGDEGCYAPRGQWVGRGKNQIVINNMIYHSGDGIAFWWYGGQTQNTALRNAVIANNTLVEQFGAGIRIDKTSGYDHENSRVENNIVLQTNGQVVTGSNTGVTYSHNNWSRQVAPAFRSDNDVVGDPQLQWGAGMPTPEWFKLKPSSPAIDKALVIPEVVDDAFHVARGATPDMGAHEY